MCSNATSNSLATYAIHLTQFGVTTNLQVSNGIELLAGLNASTQI